MQLTTGNMTLKLFFAVTLDLQVPRFVGATQILQTGRVLRQNSLEVCQRVLPHHPMLDDRC